VIRIGAVVSNSTYVTIARRRWPATTTGSTSDFPILPPAA
jgi:hypothetical protein